MAAVSGGAQHSFTPHTLLSTFGRALPIPALRIPPGDSKRWKACQGASGVRVFILQWKNETLKRGCVFPKATPEVSRGAWTRTPVSTTLRWGKGEGGRRLPQDSGDVWMLKQVPYLSVPQFAHL